MTAGASRAESVVPGTAAGEAVHGRKGGGGPASPHRSSRCARGRDPALGSPPPPPPRPPPREAGLWGETGFPGGLRLTKPTHVSFKPFVEAFTRRSWMRRGNKGGGAVLEMGGTR